ncbi:MAG: ferredoxin--NADP reductase [Bryobacteraceae bacterium]
MKARLVGWREIAPFTRNFVFEVPDSDRLAFVPGQFLSFIAEINEKEITRAYSVASPPNGNRFEICLNRVEDGLFSPHLFDLKPGDLLEFRGPYGAFHFRNPVGDSILVATGTGITPFRSMLHAQLPVDNSHRFTLIFGVRHEHGLLYRDELEGLERNYSNFRFLPTLTRPGANWAGRTGRVQGHLIDCIQDNREIDIYVCGMKEMVDETRTLLKSIGFERKRIIFEKYD